MCHGSTSILSEHCGKCIIAPSRMITWCNAYTASWVHNKMCITTVEHAPELKSIILWLLLLLLLLSLLLLSSILLASSASFLLFLLLLYANYHCYWHHYYQYSYHLRKSCCLLLVVLLLLVWVLVLVLVLFLFLFLFAIIIVHSLSPGGCCPASEYGAGCVRCSCQWCAPHHWQSQYSPDWSCTAP